MIAQQPSDARLQESRKSFQEELAHYETPPLVRGGQGRTAQSKVDAAILIAFMFVAVALIAIVIHLQWLAVAASVIVIVLAIVGSISISPAEPTETPEAKPTPPVTREPVDITG